MDARDNFTTRTLAKISAVLGEKIIEVAGTQSTISVNNYVIYGSAYYTQKVGQSRNVHIIAGENKSEPNIWEQNIACIPNGSIC